MASTWYSLVSQKLYLAQILIREFDQPTTSNAASTGLPAAVIGEARSQAVAEVLLRARDVLLTMIARLHQKRRKRRTAWPS